MKKTDVNLKLSIFNEQKTKYSYNLTDYVTKAYKMELEINDCHSKQVGKSEEGAEALECLSRVS